MLHTTEKMCYHRRWSLPPTAQSGGVCLSASPGFASENPFCPLALCCVSIHCQAGVLVVWYLWRKRFVLLYSFLKTEEY